MKTNIFHLNRGTLKAKRVGAKIKAYALGNANSLSKALFSEAWRITILSLGRVKSLTSRIRILNNFTQVMYRYYRHHGSTFTVKLLKANSVALQRYLAGSPYHSLREIEPKLPLPRLYSGLPGMIPVADRRCIQQGHIGIIRYWLSIFNIYRILDAPLSPKLNTITDPYSGEEDIKVQFKDFVSSNLWRILPGTKPSDIRTSASYIFKSQSAGPNTYNSMYAYFTDLCWWAQSEEDYAIFRQYCSVSRSSVLFKKFDNSIELLFNLLSAGARIPLKGSFSYDSSVDTMAITRLPKVPGKTKRGKVGFVTPQSLLTPLRGGQLALKVEAAGKLRVFAIVDIWTQSVLNPLHKSIFSLLRRLPNDGTFDQDESFRRCQSKASTFGNAFSIDLSSATDRLPISIQADVLDVLTGKEGFGSAWSKLLTNREYILPSTYEKDETFNGLSLPFGKGLKYATGQPMGGLSSWAMLALTHHLIVQFAAHRVGARAISPWYDLYEVLGDDLVIFDDRVAAEYQVIMNALGVDTNPSKSIPSPCRPVCEFAKRTSVGYHDVSGLSWKEFLQGNNLPGKINLALRLGSRMLISSECLLKAILVRFGSDMKKPTLSVGVGHALIGILGSLISKSDNRSLIPILSLLADPDCLDGEEYNPREVNIPSRQAVQAILEMMNGRTLQPESLISRYRERKDFVRSEIAPFASQTTYLTALATLKSCVSTYDAKVTMLCDMLIECSRVTDPVLKSQIRSVAEDILLQDTDPQDYLDEVTERLSKFREEPPLEVALALAKEIEAFSRSFDLQLVVPKGEIPVDNSLALMASRAGDRVPIYWNALPEFGGYPELGWRGHDWLRPA